jgi:hypothetical protein
MLDSAPEASCAFPHSPPLAMKDTMQNRQIEVEAKTLATGC